MAYTNSMWRTEAIHPLIVHFPIVLLIVSSVLWLFTLLVRRENSLRQKFDFSVDGLLLIGVISAWAAVYTGNLAEEVVNRVICDPTVTHRHEDLAQISTWLFSAALTMRILTRALSHRFMVSKVDSRIRCCLIGLVSLLMCAGSIVLTLSAHLGASLVYLQGAAVYRPTDSCQEFE